jgi:hypothetical protein
MCLKTIRPLRSGINSLKEQPDHRQSRVETLIAGRNDVVKFWDFSHRRQRGLVDKWFVPKA